MHIVIDRRHYDINSRSHDLLKMGKLNKSQVYMCDLEHTGDDVMKWLDIQCIENSKNKKVKT